MPGHWRALPRKPRAAGGKRALLALPKREKAIPAGPLERSCPPVPCAFPPPTPPAEPEQRLSGQKRRSRSEGAHCDCPGHKHLKVGGEAAAGAASCWCSCQRCCCQRCSCQRCCCHCCRCCFGCCCCCCRPCAACCWRRQQPSRLLCPQPCRSTIRGNSWGRLSGEHAPRKGSPCCCCASAFQSAAPASEV